MIAEMVVSIRTGSFDTASASFGFLRYIVQVISSLFSNLRFRKHVKKKKETYTAGTKLSIYLVLLAAFANQYSEIILPSDYLLTCVWKVLSWFV